MSVKLKDSDSQYDCMIDWLDWLGAATITTSSWVVEPAGELLAGASAFEDTAASVTVSGGVKGRVYRLANTITTSSGETVVRSITVRGADQ